MKMLKASLLLGIFAQGVVAMLWVMKVISQEAAIDYFQKVGGLIVVFIAVGFSVQLVMGRNKSQGQGDGSSQQGPRF